MSGEQPAANPDPDGHEAGRPGPGEPGRAVWSHGAYPSEPRVRRTTMLLAAAAGFADAVGFLVLFGLFTAHMSGNSTHLGVSLGTGDWSDAVTRFFPIPMFVVGIAVGAAALEALGRRGFGPALALLLAVEAGLIGLFMVGGQLLADDRALQPNSAGFFLLAGVATLAMGLQTSILRRVGGVTVHTTFISGMLTQVATSGVAWRFARADARRGGEGLTPTGEPADAVAGQLRFTGAIWLCYVAGGATGAYLHGQLELWALVLPIAALLGVAVWDLRHGLTR